ncbi:unnamed protein product [Oncorhynchus mykiss]|uniref:Uncharacterized protein n=1 Tax=Oncorhynchus mykiss TaxID=8022 RepID=A0A060WP42_ONCMY|nr:unnamed protein product [Oncorhynchus mykiss]
MQWKESGGVDMLFSHLCAHVIHPHLQQLYSSDVFRGKTDRVANEDDREEMRHEVESDVSDLPGEFSVLHETMDPERMGHNVELTPLHHNGTDNPPEDIWDTVHDESRFEVSHPELPLEDSMHVHPSGMERETPSNVTWNTQVLSHALNTHTYSHAYTQKSTKGPPEWRSVIRRYYRPGFDPWLCYSQP